MVKKIYDCFTTKLKKGNVYIILGENGAGKSTLVDIIMGLHTDNLAGNIKINGFNINELDMKYLRKNNIALAEQEPFLFEESILNNIILDNDNYDKNKLEELLNYFNLSAVINKLPNGINSILYENTINLSGGEKQKLSLIRTFLKNTDLIILDEPTNALDVFTKEKLVKYLDSLKKDRIIVIITHDRELFDIGDEVIEIKKNN